MAAAPTAGAPAIRRVAVVATGVIGASWATHFLAQGLDVVATDPAPGAEERLRASVDQFWPTVERLGLAPGASRARLAFEPTLEAAVRDVGFVQENGPEREDLKIELFRRLDAATPPDVILSSSSSGLQPSRFQSACVHPERVVLGHPFNPPHLIPLVEVVGGERTSAQTIARTMAFYAAVGKTPIHLRKESKGHVANRLQAALWREAFHLVDQGIASVEDVDIAIAQGPGLRWAVLGPFLNLHLSGGEGGIGHLIDHLGGPIADWWADLGEPAITPALKARLAAGVEDELRGRSRAQLEALRDGLLVDLIAEKRAAERG